MISLLLQHGIGWICLRIASPRVQTCWHDEPKKKTLKANPQGESIVVRSCAVLCCR